MTYGPEQPGLAAGHRVGYQFIHGRGTRRRRMNNYSLHCFGVGDGWPCADRNHSSFLYRFGRTSILIDCGDGASNRFKATGAAYDSIDALFISHLHADHFAGLFMLLQGFWLEGRKKALPVHLPADGVKPIREMLQAATLFPELFRFEVGFHPLRAGKTVALRGVKVTPFATTHLDRLKARFQKKYPQRFEAFSFLIEAGKLRIGHSADLSRPGDLAPLLGKPLDLLVCELAHFRAESLFRYLRDKPVKRVIFIHLARNYWKNLSHLRSIAAKSLPGVQITFARDNQEFDICRYRK
jgi:ribonuclease BN (tRNA processing enzyme)